MASYHFPLVSVLILYAYFERSGLSVLLLVSYNFMKKSSSRTKHSAPYNLFLPCVSECVCVCVCVCVCACVCVCVCVCIFSVCDMSVCCIFSTCVCACAWDMCVCVCCVCSASYHMHAFQHVIHSLILQLPPYASNAHAHTYYQHHSQ